MADLYNIDLEKKFLSGTILNPDTRAETTHIRPEDLSVTNRVVLSGIDSCLSSQKQFSVDLLIDRLESLSIKIADSIEPGIYIKSLQGLSVNDKATVTIARELRRIANRREIHAAAVEIAALASRDVPNGESEPLKSTELLARATEIFNKKVNLLSGKDEDEPADLFGTVGDFLSQETIYDKRAINLPFAVMNDLYGALDIGVTVICSRMKVGKSTFWLSTLRQLAAEDKDNNFRALVLDTELTKEENQSRALAAASGVKEYLIRYKKYKKNPEMRKKVEEAEAMLSPLAGRVDHVFVGGKSLEHMLSVARRWAFKTLKEGKKGLIVLDYIKLSGTADFASKNPLFLNIGAKIEAFKNLSKELSLPILTFCQANRENEDTKGGGRMQNTAVVGGSDMIAQFASNVYLLEKLAPEDRMRMCPDLRVKFTHRLLPLVTRVLGPDDMMKNRLVKYRDEGGKKDRFCDNYVLFNFDTFNVKECEQAPTFYDLVERNRIMGIPVDQPPPGASGGPML